MSQPTLFETRKKLESEDLNNLYSTYGSFWCEKLVNLIYTETLGASEFCDYANLLFNSLTKKEASRVENIIGTKLALNDGKIIDMSDSEHIKLIEDLGVYIFNSMPELVKGVIEANDISPSDLAIYATTISNSQKNYRTVCRMVYQSYKLAEFISSIDQKNVYDVHIVHEIKRICVESPSFDSILKRNVCGLGFKKEEELKKTREEYINNIVDINCVVAYFFNGEIELAYNKLVEMGIDMTISKFMV